MRAAMLLLALLLTACGADRTGEPEEDAGITDSTTCPDGSHAFGPDAICLPDHNCQMNDAGSVLCS